MKSSFIQLLKQLNIYYWLKILFSKTQHRKELLFYNQFLKKNDLCFDVGANVGNRTHVFLELQAKVVCVEPQKKCVQQLRKLFGNNQNIIIVDKALSDKEGYAEMAISEENSAISTISTAWQQEGRFAKDTVWLKGEKVSLTTLDILIEKYGKPKFCKIDVEGFEETVLKGLTTPIQFISFEFNIELFDSTKKCIDYLSFLGYTQFNYSLGESMKLSLPSYVSGKELIAKIESMKDVKLLWGDIYVKYK